MSTQETKIVVEETATQTDKNGEPNIIAYRVMTKGEFAELKNKPSGVNLTRVTPKE